MLLPRTVCVECRRIWIASRPVALIREQCCGTLSRDRPANRGTENVSVPLKWRVGFRFDSLEWELRQTDGSYHAGFDSGSSGITRSRSLRQMRTILNCIGSSRYTMRNGGWTISRRRGRSNSGTIRPIWGWSLRALMRVISSSMSRSPTSGTPCSAYQALGASRSATADSAKRMAIVGILR